MSDPSEQPDHADVAEGPDPFARMSIREFDEILKDDSHPLHDLARKKQEEITAPLRRAFAQSPTFMKWSETQAQIGQSLLKSLPTFDVSWTESHHFGEATPAIDTEVVVMPRPAAPGGTVTDLEIGLLKEANRIGEEQLAATERGLEASDNAAADALEVAKGARRAAWWAVVVAGVGILATIGGIAVTIVGILVTTSGGSH